jgi:hypothetical protein
MLLEQCRKELHSVFECLLKLSLFGLPTGVGVSCCYCCYHLPYFLLKFGKVHLYKSCSTAEEDAAAAKENV